MLPFRRQRSWQRRVTDAARQAPQKGRELRSAAAQLDLPWARSLPARFVRERFMQLVLNPIMDYYAARGATGREKLAAVKGPIILVANHASHMDTPIILSALPRRLRKRTAVAAAADYFYRNRLLAATVSLIFNTVPIERVSGGGGASKSPSHLDRLLDDGWNLLLYPEGTRRSGGMGRVRRGAAVLASHHNLTIVPIRVTGTAAAMPPGRIWPRRLRGQLFNRRHTIEVSFGEPIPPDRDTTKLIERVQAFFDASGDGGPSRSPYTRSVARAAATGAKAAVSEFAATGRSRARAGSDAERGAVDPAAESTGDRPVTTGDGLRATDVKGLRGAGIDGRTLPSAGDHAGVNGSAPAHAAADD